jgi:hypothetical protein
MEDFTELDKLIIRAYDECFGDDGSISSDKIFKFEGIFDSKEDFAKHFYSDRNATWDKNLDLKYVSQFIGYDYMFFSR